MMKQRVIYPGTFDPITNGHIDIIQRAAAIFPDVVVAVASNSAKKPYFSIDLRISLIEKALEHVPSIKVIGFDNLLIDCAREQRAGIILRGLRAVNDFEYEFQLAGMNRQLSPDIETLFLTPSEHFLFISSSLIREIVQLKGDISPFVPHCVLEAFATIKGYT